MLSIKFLRSLLLLFVLSVLSAQANSQQPVHKKLNRAILQTLAGKPFSVSATRKKLLAFVFLSPECPLCKNYSLVLNKLQEKYDADLDITGVFPGKAYTLNDYTAFQKKYAIRFTLLTDTANSLSRMVAAKVTPEVFLFDQQRNLVYQGAIDDWAVSLGKQKSKAATNYLEEAIKSSLNGTPLAVHKTTAVGCFINDL